jgi:hypothetical protein
MYVHLKVDRVKSARKPLLRVFRIENHVGRQFFAQVDAALGPCTQFGGSLPSAPGRWRIEPQRASRKKRWLPSSGTRTAF